jgi:integrase
VRWLFLTGMRPGELVRMHRRHIRGGALLVLGAPKGRVSSRIQTIDGVRCRPRALPLDQPRENDSPARAAWKRELLAILELIPLVYTATLMSYPKRAAKWGRLRDGYVWPWEDPSALSKMFASYRLQGDTRYLYRNRHSAGYLMENALGFDSQLIADIRGHSIETSEQDYRPEQSAQDVLDRMNR